MQLESTWGGVGEWSKSNKWRELGWDFSKIVKRHQDRHLRSSMKSCSSLYNNKENPPRYLIIQLLNIKKELSVKTSHGIKDTLPSIEMMEATGYDGISLKSGKGVRSKNTF